MADATPNPADEVAKQISDLQGSLGSLQSQAKLVSLRQKVGDLETVCGSVDQRVRDVRARGYPFEKELETKVTDLSEEWTTIHQSIADEITQQAYNLEQDLRPIEIQMSELALNAGNPDIARLMITQLKSQVSVLQSKASAAESSIQGMYAKFQGEADTITKHLDQVNWMLDQVAQATFQLLPTEAGIMAVKATWIQGDKETHDDPQGVLYLTDQRLLFEQKQEVATKKILFITTEKQKVQKLLWQMPVGQVQTVQASNQGLFGHEDHIQVMAAPEAPKRSLHFHIDGQDCNLWQGLINRAKVGDFDRERAAAVEQAVVEQAKLAPSKCPQCGGAITQTVLRGMDSLNCPYCGYVIRL